MVLKNLLAQRVYSNNQRIIHSLFQFILPEPRFFKFLGCESALYVVNHNLKY